MIALERNGSQIAVTNGHWIVTHDLAVGGCITQVRFVRWADREMLVAPLVPDIAGYRFDPYSPTTCTVREQRDGTTTLVFQTKLIHAGNGPALQVIQSFDYLDCGIRRTQHFLGDLTAVAPSDFALDVWRPAAGFDQIERGLMWAAQEWQELSAAPGELPNTPASLGLFARCGAGLQLLLGDDADHWGFRADTPQETPGIVAARVDEIRLLPFARMTADAWRRHVAGGELSLSSYLAPVNYKSRPYLPFREIVMHSEPFPTYAELKAWADMGVNLLRIHEGGSWLRGTRHFWHDGVLPPYTGRQMDVMRRVVDYAHELGMKIVPYFMLAGVHPRAPAFRDHAEEWYHMAAPEQVMKFSACGDGQIWENRMCLASDWRYALLEHVVTCLDRYQFDGAYFDGSTGIHGHCWNSAHGGEPHGIQDGVLDFYRRFCERLPGRIMLHHQGGGQLNVLLANLADHIVTMEETSSPQHPLDLLPPAMPNRVQRACASVGPVPQPLLPQDGETEAPGWAFIRYKPGQGPTRTRRRAREGFPAFLAHGLVPYLYTAMKDLHLGYDGAEECRDDREGFFYFYQMLGVLDGRTFDGYVTPYEEGIRTSHLLVDAACLFGTEGNALLIANRSGKSLADVRVTITTSPAPPGPASVLAGTERPQLELSRDRERTELRVEQLSPHAFLIVAC